MKQLITYKANAANWHKKNTKARMTGWERSST